ncbi:PTS sugar transporter subunit IIA [Neobacillus kokaensis]|uniref:PTS glucose transporter subunit IIA n=1 Tax=Neobacillus kokaensis TaxID=2759023 RepID=A0ABQ3N9J4_9BACI|nr:PTS glucose transporter subunit IIA [Neobacillus kokaensis]GHI00726.1 PTS glucose transporter subunit IIA [Neobacillus kokaensis]
MLNFFKKGKSQVLDIYAPVNGEIMRIEEVPDPVFSQKMMGEGAAVMPNGGNIVAPVNGKVIQVAPTKHAIGLLADDGTEILIHVGLETVALNGEGFKSAVKEGDKVSVGQLLLEVDWEYIGAHAASTVTPIVITNSQGSGKEYVPTGEKTAVAGETVIMNVK